MIYTWLCGTTIFLGAFLLFQVQPILAKQILPWFGGSAAVWTTAMLFFQVTLFLGYLYAHLLTKRLSPRLQFGVHVGGLLLSLLTLPVVASTDWKPTGLEDPIPRILGLLAVTIGLPFFLLSSTSPLIQSWYARTTEGSLPYRYFALSNFASLAALLGYPVFVEPSLSMQLQANLWSAGFVLYAAICACAAYLSLRAPAIARPQAAVVEQPAVPIAGGTQASWIVLACCSSLLSISATNHLCQNVAAIPFLWVLPLAIYLFTFILCFESDRWYQRKYMMPLYAAAMAVLGLLIVKQTPDTSVRLVVPLICGGLFVCCMFCHGELAKRKPDARHATQYYLMISLGGALGAVLVGLGAPYFLRGNYEFPFALAACALCTLFLEYRRSIFTDIAWTAVAVGMVVVASMQSRSLAASARAMVRNFYGGLRVVDSGPSRLMVHGTICHGTQFLEASRSRTPTTYYANGTGVHLALDSIGDAPRRVGVIGLGVGTLAAYGKPRDVFRFYEINPQVVDMARAEFGFLRDTAARTEVVLGDGRLSLEREQPQNYDLLVVDAFSGDSIPVHLLSREAFQVYLRHIKPGGLLAMHVSNTALLVAPVVQKAADSLGLAALRIHTPPDPALDRYEAEWMIVGRNAQALDRPLLQKAAGQPAVLAGLRVWTDDYSSLLSILK